MYSRKVDVLYMINQNQESRCSLPSVPFMSSKILQLQINCALALPERAEADGVRRCNWCKLCNNEANGTPHRGVQIA